MQARAKGRNASEKLNSQAIHSVYNKHIVVDGWYYCRMGKFCRLVVFTVEVHTVHVALRHSG